MFSLTQLPRTLAAALRDARDPKPHVRISAVRDLGRWTHGDSRSDAVATLEQVLTGDAVAAVRAEAALALADAGAAEAQEALLQALEADDSPRVRELALVALGEIGEEPNLRVRRAIERALASPSPELRFQAVIALHRSTGAQALQRVLACSDDEDVQVRYICFRIAEEQCEAGVLPSPAWRERARAALGDAAGDVRLAVAILLARVGDAAAGPELARALNAATRPAHLDDEQTAIKLVGELGLRAARPGLVRRAWGLFGRDPGQAWAARAALARMDDERAKAAILKSLGAVRRETRNHAIAAAARAGLREARGAIVAMRGNERHADQQTIEEALAVLELDGGLGAT